MAFLATFVATLLGSFLAMLTSTKFKRNFMSMQFLSFFFKKSYAFFTAFIFFSPHTKEFLWLSRIFYVWVSVFNLFIISSAWSLIADLFNKERSQRLFGIISSRASLGSFWEQVWWVLWALLVTMNSYFFQYFFF